MPLLTPPRSTSSFVVYIETSIERERKLRWVRLAFPEMISALEKREIEMGSNDGNIGTLGNIIIMSRVDVKS